MGAGAGRRQASRRVVRTSGAVGGIQFRADMGGAGFDIGLIGGIGRIGVSTELADVEGFLGIFVPLGVAVLAEVVAIVAEKFLQTGAADVGELEFRFLGSAGDLAALGDVLVAAAGGLNHLVVGAGLAVNETVAEAHSGVVDDLGFLVGAELLVATVRGNHLCLMGRMRRRGRIRRLRLVCPVGFRGAHAARTVFGSSNNAGRVPPDNW